MQKSRFLILAAVFCTAISALFSCNDGETYAEKKDKEKKGITRFIADNEICGKITVISEAQFYAQDSITDTTRNEFVLFNEDGIYMQIVRKGEGESMVEMTKKQIAQGGDSSINKKILCRFLEYDILGSDTTYTNYYSPSIVDKMLCSYNHHGRSYSAAYTEGYMMQYYKSSVVPKGWLKPLDYIRLTKKDGRNALVRLIVPHTSGTKNASGYVYPMYYEISYQLGR